MVFITLATACHQGWSANLFTNATDMFPQKVSGSVVGLGATAGGIGGMFMTLLVGLAVQWTGTQQIAFILAGVMHVLALALFWFWFKAKFVQVNVDAGLDTRAMHKGLVAAAVVVLAVGIWLLSFVSQQWDYIVSIVKFSGALQAAIAAGGFGLIGLALGYAGLPKKARLAV